MLTQSNSASSFLQDQPAPGLFDRHSNLRFENDPAGEKPRFIPSVVESEGLGNFVYLKGSSGKRYVFSAISREQASLYDNAVFAGCNSHNAIIGFSRSTSALCTQQSPCEASPITHYFVHLLGERDGTDGEVIADLQSQIH